MSDDALKIQRLEKRFQRERKARKEAETLLEKKSLELYESNLELKGFAENLEKIVEKRTAELKIEKDRALELSVAKSRFVATMSHEIRTPINGVMGALNLLAAEPLNKSSLNLLGIAKHSSEVLLHVINDILDFSKIEAGQMSMENIAFDLKNQLHDVVNHFCLSNQHKAVEISLSFSSDVSPYLWGDVHRLTQVLNNFMSNALKFTEKGTVTLKVFLSESMTNSEGKRVRFEVQDSGIGISEEGLTRLFKDFSQVDASTSRQYGGTGLGLVICKKIIELMGGQVGVSSEQGKGSCFWAEIPYRPAKAHEVQTDASSAFDTSENDLKCRILLVDDNLVNRKIGEKVLEKFGHEVTLADSGLAALKLLEDSAFDLIFMDCQMPEMDGFEATMEIRQRQIRTPVIALTANTSEEDKQEAKDAGMDDFVSKPFQPEKIQKVILHWIQQ